MFLRKVPVHPIRMLPTAWFLHLLREPELQAAANALARYDQTPEAYLDSVKFRSDAGQPRLAHIALEAAAPARPATLHGLASVALILWCETIPHLETSLAAPVGVLREAPCLWVHPGLRRNPFLPPQALSAQPHPVL